MRYNWSRYDGNRQGTRGRIVTGDGDGRGTLHGRYIHGKLGSADDDGQVCDDCWKIRKIDRQNIVSRYQG